MRGFEKISLGFLVFVLFFASYVYSQQLSEDAVGSGREYMSKGMYKEAIVAFSDAIDKDKRNVEAYFGRAMAYQGSNNFSKAIEDYTKLIEITKGNAQHFYNRGMAYYYNDNLDLAIADWTKSIELCPDCPESYNKRAFAYFKQEKYALSWADVHKLEGFEYAVDARFLADLKRFSNRDK
jgi:tetratricopeptide (TPR) repeat protein